MQGKLKILYDYLMPASDISAYSELFFRTADDHIKAVDECVSKVLLSKNPDEITEEIYRRVHSLKGSSTVMGQTAIADLCEQIGKIVHPAEGVFEASENKVDELKQLIEALKTSVMEAKG